MFHLILYKVQLLQPAVCC